MLWGSVVSLVEYTAAFSGLLNPTPIETVRGPFLKGVISIFYGLEDGSLHYRMYGIFAEPGTYAMFLLPVIAYAWLRGSRWSVAIFLICLWLTDSLGGFAGLVGMAVTYSFWRSRMRRRGLFVGLILGALLIATGANLLQPRFERKGASATVREENVFLVTDNALSVIAANPFGMPLTGKSLSTLASITNNYLGSNFEIYTVFVKGGIIALCGYFVLLLRLLTRSTRLLLADAFDLCHACALVCLPAMLLFIFQRDTILSSVLFAFLFAQPLLNPPGAGIPSRAADGERRRRRRPATAPPLVLDN